MHVLLSIILGYNKGDSQDLINLSLNNEKNRRMLGAVIAYKDPTVKGMFVYTMLS